MMSQSAVSMSRSAVIARKSCHFSPFYVPKCGNILVLAPKRNPDKDVLAGDTAHFTIVLGLAEVIPHFSSSN